MGNRSWLVWPLAAWLLFAVAALWLAHGNLALDTDSAMRLVQVRDLLAGQGWFDTVQHRMNTRRYGLPMHWSRLEWMPPLALLSLISRAFRADRLWPLILAGGAAAASFAPGSPDLGAAHVEKDLGGRPAIACGGR